MHRFTVFGYWHPPLYFQEEGGGGGAKQVPLPGAAESDIEILGGDDDADEAEEEVADEGEEAEAEGKPAKQKRSQTERKPEGDQEDFDVDLGDKQEDEEPSDEEEEEPERAARREEEEGEAKPQGFKALKEAYPDIFKKFPDLRKSLGEHQAFRSIFTSVEEAKETIDQASRFNQVADTLFAGDFASLVDGMENEEKGSFAKLSQNILPTIREKNKDLYFTITEPVLQEFLHAAFTRANASGDEKLKNSTYWLNNFLTGQKGFPSVPGRREAPGESEADKKIAAFETQRMNESQKMVWGDIRTRLAHQIDIALDPTGKKLKGKDKTKDALIRSLISEVDDTIAKDEIHMNKVSRLWNQARRSSYSRDHLSRITSAYLDRAKTVMPKLVQKVREENGLLDEAPRKEERRDKEEQEPQRTNNRPPPRLTGGKTQAPKTLRDVNPRKIDYRRTSDADIMSGRVRMKR